MAKKPMNESPKARAACEEYLLMGPGRSLAKLCVAMKRPPGYERTLKEWSAAFDWVAKAKEYDQEQAAARREEIEAQRREMDKEHALWGRDQALLAMQTIQALLKEGKYNPASANQLFKISTGLQRLAMGSATEQIALTGKDGDPLVDVETIVETFWGRGTDPRRKSPESNDPAGTADEDLGEDEEFGIDVPEDDE